MTAAALPAPPVPLFDTAVVAGVGLIGGSLALGLRQRSLARRVIGYDASIEVLREAEALGVVDEIRTSPGEWLRGADLVVLAAPMRAQAPLARELAPFLNPAALVTDVGSVKSGIAQVAEELGIRNFVAGH
uniref:prephenate dehydrogenase/arogenate dehydrogenase family protein n=1 Tax=Deinococcus sp. TaxID=47478 RepID=UPI0025C4C180